MSKVARFVLDRMEPDRRYEVVDLRAFVPDASPENLREVMHELWVNRQVERVGHSGWQRRRSAPPYAQHDAGDIAAVSAARPAKAVKPEELFDHDAFADFFS